MSTPEPTRTHHQQHCQPRRRTSRSLLAAASLGLLATGGALGCAATGGNAEGERLSRIQLSPHYDLEREVFFNPKRVRLEPPKQRGGSFSMMKRFFFGDAITRPPKALPQERPDLDAFAAADGFRAVWLGHSSFLLRVAGKTLLFDPVLSTYASPVPGFIKRFQAPVLGVDQLPTIDAVVISHDHYDHLDMGTIRALRSRVGRFFVPLGVGAHLEGWGVARERIVELDWWQSARLGQVDLTLTPARHFSGRGLSDRNHTLWGSWVVQGAGRKLYFSGDSGYGPHFKQIGQRFGPFDVVFLENGQYSEDWPDVHLLPDRGVQAFADLGGKRLIPVRMFDLSTHNWWDPIETLVAHAAAHAMPLMTPKIGALIDLDAPPRVVPWWRPLLPESVRRPAPALPAPVAHRG